MTITQTVEIPADRRIILEVPREVTTDSVVLTLTPVSETGRIDFVDAVKEDVITTGEEILDKHIAAFEALAK